MSATFADEQVLLTALRAGQENAFTHLVKTYHGKLLGAANLMVGERFAEEVVQETLLRVLRDLQRYEPERAAGNIFPWLTGLARNEIQRVLGREKAATSLQTLWERMDRELLSVFARLESEPFSDEMLQREETRDLVNGAMSQLPPHYRQALEAKYVSGESVRTIAERWRMTEKAAESMLTRARQAFRAAFGALCRNLEVEVNIGCVD